MKISRSRERVRQVASESGWDARTDRPGLMIFSRPATDGERRLIVWFQADDKVRAATLESDGGGTSIRLEPGVANVLWHLEFWARLGGARS